MLVSRGKCVCQCWVYRSFEVDSDHFPVVAQFRIKLNHIHQRKVQSFCPNLRRLNDMEFRKQFSQTITEALLSDSSPNSTPSHQSVESMWSGYKTALNTAASTVLGPAKCGRKPWISAKGACPNADRRNADQ